MPAFTGSQTGTARAPHGEPAPSSRQPAGNHRTGRVPLRAGAMPGSRHPIAEVNWCVDRGKEATRHCYFRISPIDGPAASSRGGPMCTGPRTACRLAYMAPFPTACPSPRTARPSIQCNGARRRGGPSHHRVKALNRPFQTCPGHNWSEAAHRVPNTACTTPRPPTASVVATETSRRPIAHVCAHRLSPAESFSHTRASRPPERGAARRARGTVPAPASSSDERSEPGLARRLPDRDMPRATCKCFTHRRVPLRCIEYHSQHRLCPNVRSTVITRSQS